jgi:predicted O-methyltransferase YrrM
VPAQAGRVAAADARFFVLVREGGSGTLTPHDLEPCDAVFIDGDHSEGAVRHDSHLARALVRPGGIIVWHDYLNPSVEVTKALGTLRDEGWPIESVDNTWLAFVRCT